MTPGAGPFWPKGYNLNKLGRSLLGDAIYQKINSLGLLISDKKIFSCYPYIKLCKQLTPRAGVFFFGPRAIIIRNMVEVY